MRSGDVVSLDQPTTATLCQRQNMLRNVPTGLKKSRPGKEKQSPARRWRYRNLEILNIYVHMFAERRRDELSTTCTRPPLHYTAAIRESQIADLERSVR